MSKVWTIITYEYRRHVLRKRFLFALLSIPLWLLIMAVVAVLAVVLTLDNTPIGYVDHSGVLANPVAPSAEEGPLFTELEMIPYPQEQAARTDLDAGKIQAYYVLEADFLQTRHARLVSKEEPGDQVSSDFESLLSRTLAASLPDDVSQRIFDGPVVVTRTTQEDLEAQNETWLKIAIPFAAVAILLLVIFSTGGYLMQSVVEEKENRTMEILATSLSPMQIMGGKIIALIGVGLTQVLVWAFLPILALILAVIYIPTFQASMDWPFLGLFFLLLVPTFVMISAFMAAIGATVTESSEGQQITGLITLPVMVPIMLINVLMSDPGSPISVFLSLFPLTSANAILIRMATSTVPAWQIAVAVALLILSAIGSLWLAGRIFRLGMLRYGQRLRWKDIFASFTRQRAQ